jgi:hypothetical protein
LNSQDGSVLLATFIFVIYGIELYINDQYRVVLDSTTLVFNIYGSIGRVLFAVLCKLIADLYSSIGKKIEKMTIEADGMDVTEEDMANSLKRLKIDHLLLFRSVNKLNRCFGHILLFDIIFTFIGFINWSMYSLTTYVSAEVSWLYMMLINSVFIEHTANLTLICISSDRIYVKVINKFLVE